MLAALPGKSDHSSVGGVGLVSKHHIGLDALPIPDQGRFLWAHIAALNWCQDKQSLLPEETSVV
eukprot:826461-Amphidinium_carterae.1